MFNRILTAALAVVLAFSLSACASFWDNILQPTPSQSSSEAPPEPEAVFSAEPIPEAMQERMDGVSWENTERCPDFSELSLLTLSHYSFDGATHTGQMIVSAEMAAEVCDIFRELYDAKFPIEKIRLIDEYEADDNLSMDDNNSSAFCFREIAGTDYLSNHSFGLAIDINTLQNPFVSGETVTPEAGRDYLDRENVRPGMIVKGNVCYEAFVSRGWEWGGEWDTPKDYQHFEKVAAPGE